MTVRSQADPGGSLSGAVERGRGSVAGGRFGRWAILAVVVAGGMAVAAILFLFRPQGQFFYPQCAFHVTTGLLCPGCGGLRSLHELLHGRIAEAARCNGLAIVGLPLVMAWWGWNRVRRGAGGAILTGRVVWVLGAIALVFTVVRNLPWEPASRWLVP